MTGNNRIMTFDELLFLAAMLSLVIAFTFSMFGQGGGSVYAPVLLILGFSTLVSSSTSLFLNLITSLSAGIVFYRNKMIDLKTSGLFLPGMIVGAFSGGILSKHFHPTIILWLFVIFLVLLGARMAFTVLKKVKENEFVPVLTSYKYLMIILVSLATGFFSGLMGIGGGILIVPFMTYLLKYPEKIAAGSSHLIIAFSAVAGIIGHAASHGLDHRLMLATGIAVLIGGYTGARFSMKLKPKVIRIGLGLILWALAAQILIKLIT